MQISGSRVAALVMFDLVVFAVTAFVMLQWMPKPLKPVDYLLVGVVATLVSLLGVWLLLLREAPNRSEVLYKKRLRKLNGEDVE